MLEINLGQKTYENINFVSGSFFLGNDFFDREAAESKLFEIINSDCVLSILALVNGFYNGIFIKDNKLYLLVDHVRSYPLFYSIQTDKIIVSECAMDIKTTLGLTYSDVSISREVEFCLTGYVTGSNTLFDDIKQVQAGELVCIDLHTGQCIKNFFFQNYSIYPEVDDQINLFIEHQKVLQNIVDRLIHFAQGRQIVIPLSAGHDSLLLACLLKNRGYSDVIAFTYGVVNNSEAFISQKRAKELGIEWYFVEYKKDDVYRQYNNDNKLNEYFLYSGNLSSLPHIQDYLAVKELVAKGIVKEGAVFLPGHCATGYSMPEFIYTPNTKLSKEDIVKCLFDKHYVNNNRLRVKYKSFFLNIIDESLKGIKFDNSPSFFTRMIEFWSTRERESKYIVNSMAVYKFFGCTFWMPLWDIEYANFWKKVNYLLKSERQWYNHYVEHYYRYTLKKDEFKPSIYLITKPSLTLFKRIKRSFVLYPLRIIQYFLNMVKHPLGFNFIVSNTDLFFNTIKGNHILYLYTKKYLSLLRK